MLPPCFLVDSIYTALANSWLLSLTAAFDIHLWTALGTPFDLVLTKTGSFSELSTAEFPLSDRNLYIFQHHTQPLPFPHLPWSSVKASDAPRPSMTCNPLTKLPSQKHYHHFSLLYCCLLLKLCHCQLQLELGPLASVLTHLPCSPNSLFTSNLQSWLTFMTHHLHVCSCTAEPFCRTWLGLL